MARKAFVVMCVLSVLTISSFAQSEPIQVTVTDNDTSWWSKQYVITNLPEWHNKVAYQIFVRSFFDSDGNGIGDFKGIIQKLDYLKSLGVDYIWLMPIHPSVHYHGYDVTDFYSVNPDYGTMSDFEEMVKEANKKGVKIILDLVYNHTSREHPWFVDSATNEKSKYKNWYVWSKEKPSGDWPNPTGQSTQPVWNIYNFVSNAYRFGHYFYSAFNFTIPDLNYENQEVVNELKKISKFWFDKGVYGFRIDAARFAIAKGPDKQADTQETISFWKDFMNYIKKIKPDAYVVAEIFAGPDIVKMYYQNGTTFTSGFNFEFSTSVVIPALVASRVQAPISKVKQWLSSKDIPITFLSPFLSNHDVGRFGSKIRNDQSIKSALAMLLTLPGGMPFLYYGDEIGLPDDKKVIIGDGDKRSIMFWDSSKFGGFTTGPRIWHARYDAQEASNRNLALQINQQDSIFNITKNLIRLRKTYPALSSFADTKFIELDAKTPLMTYVRKLDKQIAIVIMNVSKSSPLNIDLDLSTVLEGNYKFVDGLNSADGTIPAQIGNSLTSNKKATLEIPARNFVIIILEK